MDIKIGDKVRVNQMGLDTPASSLDWCCIPPGTVNRTKRLGTGTVTGKRVHYDEQEYLSIDFQDPDTGHLFWPAKFFEKVPEEKLEFTQEEKELLRELVQDKLKGYQQLLGKLR